MSPSTAAGKEALAYCTSCKMDLAHIIVAMKGDKIAKAECKTCKKTHSYKTPKGITEPPKPKKKKKAAADDAIKSSDIESEWIKLMTANKANPTVSYSTKTSLKLGDKLKHPQFGEGIVGKLLYPNKVEVIFQHDIKILIHGGTQPALVI